ncbi:hypothetical protein GPL06_16260 [Bacteroides salyersiae]|nr:hypothetical protein [Bacteroides salyersiae]
MVNNSVNQYHAINLRKKKDKTNYLLVFFLNLEKWGHLATKNPRTRYLCEDFYQYNKINIFK